MVFHGLSLPSSLPTDPGPPVRIALGLPPCEEGHGSGISHSKPLAPPEGSLRASAGGDGGDQRRPICIFACEPTEAVRRAIR